MTHPCDEAKLIADSIAPLQQRIAELDRYLVAEAEKRDKLEQEKAELEQRCRRFACYIVGYVKTAPGKEAVIKEAKEYITG